MTSLFKKKESATAVTAHAPAPSPNKLTERSTENEQVSKTATTLAGGNVSTYQQNKDLYKLNDFKLLVTLGTFRKLILLNEFHGARHRNFWKSLLVSM
jgi:hypothetical protein